MTKTQLKLIERVKQSTRHTKDGKRFINLSNLLEIDQAYKLAEKQPTKYNCNCLSWRCVDFITLE